MCEGIIIPGGALASWVPENTQLLRFLPHQGSHLLHIIPHQGSHLLHILPHQGSHLLRILPQLLQRAVPLPEHVPLLLAGPRPAQPGQRRGAEDLSAGGLAGGTPAQLRPQVLLCCRRCGSGTQATLPPG